MGSHLSSRSNICSYFRNKSLKFFRLWIIWLVIYLPLDIMWGHQCNVSPNWIVAWAYHALTTGEGSRSWPLWFIFSMSIGCFLLSFACSRKRILPGTILVFSMATILYVQAYIHSSTNIQQTTHGLWVLNHLSISSTIAERIFSGAIFIPAGIIISRIKYDNSATLKILTFAIILVMIGCIMEHDNVLLNALPRGIGITLIGICLPQIKIQTKSIRQQSMWIYYTHMYCLGFLAFLNVVYHPALYFTLAIILSIIIGFVLTTLTKVKNFRFLRVLIS